MAHIIEGISNQEYRALDAWSKSDLDYISKSVALYEWSRNTKQSPTPATIMGSCLHSMVLEPENFSKEFALMPDFNLHTKEGRLNAELFHENNKDKTVVDSNTYNTCKDMLESIKAHPVANSLLFSSGKSEVSVLWESNGIKLKSRFDRVPDVSHFGHYIVDLKKTVDIFQFNRSIRKFRYDVQAAFYSDAYFQLHGVHPTFVFVVVDEQRNLGRHEVRVMKLNAHDIQEARIKYHSDLEDVAEYLEFGSSLDIEVIELNRY